VCLPLSTSVQSCTASQPPSLLSRYSRLTCGMQYTCTNACVSSTIPHEVNCCVLLHRVYVLCNLQHPYSFTQQHTVKHPAALLQLHASASRARCCAKAAIVRNASWSASDLPVAELQEVEHPVPLLRLLLQCYVDTQLALLECQVSSMASVAHRTCSRA
jgi:hypothetical protein